MFCPECGNQNPDNAKFCIKCGYQYSQNTSPVDSSKPSSFQAATSKKTNRASSRFPIILGASLVGLLLIYFLFFFAGTKFTVSDRIDILTGKASPGYAYRAFFVDTINLEPEEKREIEFEVPANWRGVELDGDYSAQGRIKLTITDGTFPQFERNLDGTTAGSINGPSLPVGHKYRLIIDNQSETKGANFRGRIASNYAYIEKR